MRSNDRQLSLKQVEIVWAYMGIILLISDMIAPCPRATYVRTFIYYDVMHVISRTSAGLHPPALQRATLIKLGIGPGDKDNKTPHLRHHAISLDHYYYCLHCYVVVVTREIIQSYLNTRM